MLGLACASFTYVWIKFVEVNNQTGHLLGLGNILMSVLVYAALFIVAGRWFNAFKVGVERMAKMVASVLITVFVTDFLELFVAIDAFMTVDDPGHHRSVQILLRLPVEICAACVLPDCCS